MRPLCLATAVMIAATAAHAQTPYLDDRSTPERLVRSYLNALERGETARAASYLGPGEQAGDVPAETLLGATSPAAGGTSTLPVLFRFGDGGDIRVAAGCIDVAEASGDERSFRPPSITAIDLEPAQVPFERSFLPRICPGDEVEIAEGDALPERARDLFARSFADRCQLAGDASEPPSDHAIDYRFMHETGDDPMRSARLFGFPCNSGAYNRSQVYLLASDDLVEPVAFALPELDIRYIDDDIEQGLSEMLQIGLVTRFELVNSRYDPATQAIVSDEKWRGAGDASASGRWIFRYGAFTLVRYDVDATYDGEINPETVLDLDVAP